MLTLNNSPELQALEICNLNLSRKDTDGGHTVLEAIEVQASCKQLLNTRPDITKLSLLDLACDGMQISEVILASIAEYLPNLQELAVTGSGAGPGPTAAHISQLFKGCPHLRSLDLSKWAIPPTTFSAVDAPTHTLQTLTMRADKTVVAAREGLLELLKVRVFSRIKPICVFCLMLYSCFDLVMLAGLYGSEAAGVHRHGYEQI